MKNTCLAGSALQCTGSPFLERNPNDGSVHSCLSIPGLLCARERDRSAAGVGRAIGVAEDLGLPDPTQYVTETAQSSGEAARHARQGDKAPKQVLPLPEGLELTLRLLRSYTSGDRSAGGRGRLARFGAGVHDRHRYGDRASQT
jgi:hypothetical protein